MDFKDIFDSFFGFKTNENLFERKSRFDEEFNDYETEFNRDFEDIITNFGQMFEVMNQFSVFNDINDSNRWPELNTESKSPRDLMLKSNHQIKRQDTDLDEKVRRRGLDSIFNKLSNSESNAMRSPIENKSLRKSYFFSSFNNNGRIEEHKTTTDEFGNTETSVTTRIGDQSFTQITKRNNNEIIETKEIADNLDQNQLNEFKQQFIQNDGSRDENSRNKMTSNNNTNNNSVLKRILDFWTHS